MRGIPVDGDAVRRLRKARAWTQEKLAAQCGCTTRTISNAELGKALDAETLSLLSEAFEVPISVLAQGAQSGRDAVEERNKATVLEYVDRYMACDVGGLLEQHKKDAEYQFEVAGTRPLWGHFPGHGQIAGHLEFAFTELPMTGYRLKRLIAVGETVFEYAVATLQSARGVRVSTPGVNEWRIEAGKIVRRQVYFDPASQLASLRPEAIPTELSDPS